MKIASINNQNNNFKGSMIDKTASFISKHPLGVASLAASSVITQKIVMSASEVALAPALDIGVGNAISKVCNEKDDRFKQSSKLQAVRTVAQTTGGTIVGIAVRALCIGAATAGVIGGAAKAGSKLGALVTQNKNNPYELQKNGEAWGRSLGGALATVVMMGTNFLIDAPLINVINKKLSNVFLDNKAQKPASNQNKEIK